MALIGGELGGLGAASGGFGLETIYYPLVSFWFWMPLVAVGLYLLRSVKKAKEDVLKSIENDTGKLQAFVPG